ncbi:hypothetical protein DL767_008665 [Monosporascus sp. MG133]|nr:hypothetical protein DL767_008665 [Monosporascus sp. MG133]
MAGEGVLTDDRRRSSLQSTAIATFGASNLRTVPASASREKEEVQQFIDELNREASTAKDEVRRLRKSPTSREAVAPLLRSQIPRGPSIWGEPRFHMLTVIDRVCIVSASPPYA